MSENGELNKGHNSNLLNHWVLCDIPLYWLDDTDHYIILTRYGPFSSRVLFTHCDIWHPYIQRHVFHESLNIKPFLPGLMWNKKNMYIKLYIYILR